MNVSDNVCPRLSACLVHVRLSHSSRGLDARLVEAYGFDLNCLRRTKLPRVVRAVIGPDISVPSTWRRVREGEGSMDWGSKTQRGGEGIRKE